MTHKYIQIPLLLSCSKLAQNPVWASFATCRRIRQVTDKKSETFSEIYSQDCSLHFACIITPSPIHRGTGYCFRSISLYLCLFVCLLARLRENGWTDLYEIFKEGVEWPWDDVVQFLVNSEKPRDAAMLNSLSATLRVNRWTDLHKTFREGVEWPWDDLITFLVNSEKPRDAAMRNTGTGFVCFRTTACYIEFQ